MKSAAPTMHRELKTSQELPNVLRSRANQAQETYELLYSEAMDRVLRSDLPPMERTSELMQARTVAANVAINQAVEFGESEPTEGSTSSQAAAA